MEWNQPQRVHGTRVYYWERRFIPTPIYNTIIEDGIGPELPGFWTEVRAGVPVPASVFRILGGFRRKRATPAKGKFSLEVLRARPNGGTGDRSYP